MLLKGKDIAYMGVLLALNQLFIVLSSIVETNTILFFALASLIVGIVLVDFGLKKGVIFYIASCILGYFLSFNKIEIITYIIFFGAYSIIKYLVESYVVTIKSSVMIIVEYVVKLLFFNVAVLILYLILKSVIMLKILWWMIPVAEVGFIIYDYAFSVLIKYYIEKIKPKVHKK